MDETGVHSRLNVKKPIVPGIGTTSPVQTVAGKDISNPLKVVTLPKSESEEEISLKTRRKLPQTLTGSTSRARSRKTKKKPQQNIEQIIKDTLENIFKEQIRPKMEDKHENPVTTAPEIPRQNRGLNTEDIDHVSETSSENELIQYAQDPNENDDSGMSFDSIAEHNLNT
ncbi:hypothetical protein RND71_019157 [Anisodus tanguticus]|uniref:Uncharacterized protein n=1 Tax=Anisodus tanguticus TaxID=243964 RepID=A0AAE1VH55_9SOLA|nr:hypothetical protein RND71_019157 [Anisodus tanguticus]